MAYWNYYDTSDSDNVSLSSFRCSCKNCVVSDNTDECYCCQDISQIAEKTEDVGVSCIINHPGFQTVVLDPYVLETAFWGYRVYDKYSKIPLNEYNYRSYRYTAYRQLVRWCWGFLGRNNRVPLPACAVNKIRSTYNHTA